MSKERASIYPIPDRWSYLWLAIGATLTLFSSGRWPIPLAAWLGPVFMIRFMRTQKVFRGFILVWLATYVMAVIAWWGMMPSSLSLPVSLVMMAINTLTIGGLSYLADRLLAPRLKGFAATLVFPLALTALDFLAMTINPIGSFGAQAYTQYGNPALVQLLSVTGMWGITFLVNWFAPIVNWAWERSFDWRRIWRGLAIFAGIILLVMVYGSARLVFSPAPAGTVRVASLTAAQLHDEGPIDLKDDREGFRRRTSVMRERYFEQTIREARAGAQIVLWPEGAGVGLEEDEAVLIAHGRQVASQEGIILAMPLATIYEDPNRLLENKLIVVDPAGDVVLEHYKYGANFAEGSRPGDGVLRTFKSPFGTISGVICWDADFPARVRQSGRNGTDILMVPSNDVREIDPLHTQMAVYRAIENGVSLVRQASNGLSIATDPYGRVLAAMDHFAASERVMVAQVPTQGVSTAYSVIGDLFGWLAVVGFVGIVIWAVVRWRRAS
ncbi:MAG TPA: nitrilase-related carbon-nitrogen hydrolase [Anaerolineae bacterium]|nr:nitrilase-related carbon-nitrogen hydrolase [Anaerolineae bacterium]